VLANDLNLSIHNPILIYTFLALYGLLTLTMLAYVHTRFRSATSVLKTLQVEWDSAESRHAGFVGKAQEQISKLAVPAVPMVPVVKNAAVSFDMRNQVIAMGKKGFKALEIAKSCGLHEGEVDVLLGMARLQTR
jgi:hypothetical protein